jgi:hypothetical protein
VTGARIPSRLLPPTSHEEERLLLAIEEALVSSGLRTVRTSLSSVDGAVSGADVGLVIGSSIRSSRPPVRLPCVEVEALTDRHAEVARSALLAAGSLAYQRVAGSAYVEPLAREVDEQWREAALRRGGL